MKSRNYLDVKLTFKILFGNFFLFAFSMAAENIYFENRYYLYHRHSWSPVSLSEKLNEMDLQNENRKNLLRLDMQKVKMLIAQGNLSAGYQYLKNHLHLNDEMTSERYYLFGFIAFLMGQYQESLKAWGEQIVESNYFIHQKICPTQTLNYLFTHQSNQDLKKYWSNCQKINFAHARDQLQFLEVLVDMKIGNKKSSDWDIFFKKLNYSDLPLELLKMNYKLALFANRPLATYPSMERINLNFLADERLRDLMGNLLYRGKELVKAWDMNQDLSLPNSLNFKGNIFLQLNNNEKALEHFTSALKIKPDSTNALDRLIPLTFKMELYDQGHHYLEIKKRISGVSIELYTLESIFHLMKEDYVSINKNFQFWSHYYHQAYPFELSQILAYSHLIQGKEIESKSHYYFTCLQGDSIGCYQLFQLKNWNHLSYFLQDTKDLVKSESKNESELMLDEDMKTENPFIKLRDKSQTFLSSMTDQEKNKLYFQDNQLIEEIFINQSEIEELDNNLIKLISN